MKKLFFLLSGLFITSCTTTAKIVKTTYEPKKSVVISYFNQGIQSLIDDRRKDAFEKAHSFCGGEAMLASEETTKEVSGYSYSKSTHSTTIENKELALLTFNCK